MARELVISFGIALFTWTTALVPASAEDVQFTDNRPSPLIVDGKPVDTICLMHLSNEDSSWRDPIDLGHCGHDDIVIKSQSADPRMTGFSYDYRNSPSEMRQPYFLYRFLGPYRGHSLLFVEYGGGGTGEFTGIISLDIRGYILKPVDSLASGDRCNGGLWHVSLAGGHLSYHQHITPYDLVALADGAPKLEAYKDLEASASSCVANVNYQDAQWASVSLSDPDLMDQAGWTDQFRHQACFNGVYRAFAARHETELDRNGVNRFTKAFSESCLRAD